MKLEYIKPDWQEQYKKLEKGWDSYGGDPIGEQAIISAQQILDRLDKVQLVPTSRGGIALVWYIQHPSWETGYEVNLEFRSDGEQEFE